MKTIHSYAPVGSVDRIIEDPKSPYFVFFWVNWQLVLQVIFQNKDWCSA